jgi:hypothetical protein
MAGDWAAEAQPDETARWRALLPKLSIDPGDDLAGQADGMERVRSILEASRERFQRLSCRGRHGEDPPSGLGKLSGGFLPDGDERIPVGKQLSVTRLRGVISGLT